MRDQSQNNNNNKSPNHRPGLDCEMKFKSERCGRWTLVQHLCLTFYAPKIMIIDYSNNDRRPAKKQETERELYTYDFIYSHLPRAKEVFFFFFHHVIKTVN